MNPDISDEMEDYENENGEKAVMLDPAEIDEEIISDNDEDAVMESGSECSDTNKDFQISQELQLQNDSCAHFDWHKDSIFCIAQHPINLNIVATGASEGHDAGGMGYVFDASANFPVAREKTNDSSNGTIERTSLEPLFKIEGHTDSICAMTFTLPKGELLLSGGLDGKLRAYVEKPFRTWSFIGDVQEVEEINWLTPCPNKQFTNVVAFGASDGSVWVYAVDPKSEGLAFQMIQSYFLHMGSCTAGSWSNDGKLLATVSEDGSLYVWDVFGEFNSAKVSQQGAGGHVVGLTKSDQRFAVDGGLYSVAIAPNGTFLAVGGSSGSIKIVSLPRLPSDHLSTQNSNVTNGKAGKKIGGKSCESGISQRQAGQILADLNVQGDGIETLAFSPNLASFLAAGSVDGSIAIFDSAHQFAVRRLIKGAHQDHSVVKVEFVQNPSTEGYLLTSCGMDGVVRRWDIRGGTDNGLLYEWKGHRGDGEYGGVLDFVQGDGSRIVTAGDDKISLVFDSSIPLTSKP